MNNIWTIKTGYNLGSFAERTTHTIDLPVQNDTGITYSLISGSLPKGMRLLGNQIIGTPLEVVDNTTSEFVIRASDGISISDRTFFCTITGPDEPQWITNPGLLPVGPGNHVFILDNSYVNFQLSAVDADLPAGDQLFYFIGDNDGELPPGLSMSSTGLISGIIEPIISLTKASGNGFFDTTDWDITPWDFGTGFLTGYDDSNYDSFGYDFSEVSPTPKSLSRNYQFTVTVSDKIALIKRTFRIYVVTDDFVRVDNTLVQIGNGAYSSDNTYLRTPVWISNNYLGSYRAANNITLALNAYNIDPTTGPVSYKLESVNSIGTVSAVYTNNKITIVDAIAGNGNNIAFEIPIQEVPPYTGFRYTVSGNSNSDFNHNNLLCTASTKTSITLEYPTTLDYTDFGYGLPHTIITPYIRVAYNYIDNTYDDISSISQETMTITGVFNKIQTVNGYEITFDIDPISFVPPIGIKYSVISASNLNYVEQDLKSLYYSDSRITLVYPTDPTGILDDFSGNDTRIIFQWKTQSDNTVGNSVVLVDSDTTLTSGLFLSFDNVSGIQSSETFIINSITNSGTIYRLSLNKTLPANVTGSSVVKIGSLSILPPGTLLDENNGEIFGYVPYQPAITKTYNFSVTAIKYDLTSVNNVNVIIDVQNFAPVGDNILKISPLSPADAQLIKDSYLEIDFVLYRIIGYQEYGVYHELILDIPLKKSVFGLTTFVLPFRLPLSDSSIIKTTKTFAVDIIGEIENTINWITPVNLGTIEAGLPSTVSVAAISNVKSANLIYSLTSGTLPPGLYLSSNGNIIGKVDQTALTSFDGAISSTTLDQSTTTIDRTFRFSIKAIDQFGFSEISGEFYLTVSTISNKLYSNIYTRPLRTIANREKISNLFADIIEFYPDLIYRIDDPNFGIQSDLAMLIYPGIETTAIDNYMPALEHNASRQRFKMGEMATAVAKKQGSDTILYEVVYIKVVGDYEYDTVSLPSSILTEQNQVIYPPSVINMRNNFSELEIDGEKISINNLYIPQWMITPQGTALNVLGYIKAIPLCYCKPGNGSQVLSNIKNYVNNPDNNLKINDIDYEIDRLVIDNTSENLGEQYLKFK